ncbi:hypothetical protein Plhal304r1_c067g0155171 [Plasmopara halstedii]
MNNVVEEDITRDTSFRPETVLDLIIRAYIPTSRKILQCKKHDRIAQRTTPISMEDILRIAKQNSSE